MQRSNHIHQQLRRALQDGCLRLVYQPQVRLTDERIVGLEALCRWSTEPIGAVSPDEFLPIVESQDLQDDYRRWLLNALESDAAELLTRHPRLELSINFSLSEVMRSRWLTDMLDWVKRLPSDVATRLLVEVTEQSYAEPLDPVAAHFQALQAQGLRFALDDFGVGASEMTRLHALPFDGVKLDKSLVQNLTQPDVQARVKQLLSYALEHRQLVVAEGIETEEQARQTRELGIPVGQGYLFDKPQPIDHWIKVSDRFA